MHEWALAESVVYAIKKEVEKHNLKGITKVFLKIGELQMLEMDIFLSALEDNIAIHALPLKIEDVRIERERCLFKCRVCGYEWDFKEAKKGLGFEEEESIHFLPEMVHVFLKCPECCSCDFEFLGGRGIWLESIEGET